MLETKNVRYANECFNVFAKKAISIILCEFKLDLLLHSIFQFRFPRFSTKNSPFLCFVKPFAWYCVSLEVRFSQLYSANYT